MSRKEDFIQAGIDYRFEQGKQIAIGGDNFADVANEMNRCKDFEFGAEYGYQYAQTHPNWFSVEDDLPKEENLYIVSNGKETSVAYWVDDDWDTFGDVITHWMPLPQPPRKEEQNNVE